jgi:hypothetical protein
MKTSILLENASDFNMENLRIMCMKMTDQHQSIDNSFSELAMKHKSKSVNKKRIKCFKSQDGTHCSKLLEQTSFLSKFRSKCIVKVCIFYLPGNPAPPFIPILPLGPLSPGNPSNPFGPGTPLFK